MFGLFQKAKKPIQGLGSKIRSAFGKKLSKENLDQLEELLYQADLGSETVQDLIQVCEKKISNTEQSVEGLLEILKKELLARLPKEHKLDHSSSPHVTLIVGINGSGKTTSIAKLANYYKKQGRSVLLAAADTFRAAAVNQLTMWSEKLSVPIVKGTQGGDPAACVYDAMEAAKSRGVDELIIDTAGRLHTKTDLMGELQKIVRVCKKVAPSTPHDIWMVLDASIGQNGLQQAELFHQYAPLTGLVLSKWDGSAKGGACLPIQKKLGVPIRFFGIGEGAEDLEAYSPERFIETLLS